MGRCDSAYGKRIKKRLIDLNMTQVELARQLEEFQSSNTPDHFRR